MYHLIILFKIYLPGRGQKEHVSLLIDWVSLKQMISKNIQKKETNRVGNVFAAFLNELLDQTQTGSV